jgi:hypothetical protein
MSRLAAGAADSDDFFFRKSHEEMEHPLRSDRVPREGREIRLRPAGTCVAIYPKERFMKKKLEKTTAKKAAVLTLHKETLRHWVTGGVKIHIPIGFADDTTPIYAEGDDTGG